MTIQNDGAVSFLSQPSINNSNVVNDSSSNSTSSATNNPSAITQSSSSSTNYSSVQDNILYSYRSWTYNFALGAVRPSSYGTGSSINSDILNYIVLNSAGKGTAGMSGTTNSTSSSIISSFNSNSSGRFDMFIDNVTISSIVGAGTNQTGSSIATQITFDVFEPYSMNGFIEALQVSSQAAGYSDFGKAVFGLRVQFQGYPDSQTNSNLSSQIISGGTRYYCIILTDVQVEVTEQGTKYQCTAIPSNQIAYGTSNVLIDDVKVTGNTVGAVLFNLFQAINNSVKSDAQQQTNNTNAICDTYEISCPALVTASNPENVQGAMLYSGASGSAYSSTNNYQWSTALNSNMNQVLTDVNIFKYADGGSTKNGYQGAQQTTTSTNTATSVRLTPSTGVTVFAKGSQIHDCIAAVIRDSEYVRVNVLQTQLQQAKSNGSLNVTYFTIRTEIENNGFDSSRNRNIYTYRYILEPYVIPYTRIPGQEQGTEDFSPIALQLIKAYNYIYTGKNLDILKLQLQFNNLYFAALAPKLGNRPSDPSTTQAAAPNNTVQTSLPTSAVTTSTVQGMNSIPTPSMQVDTKKGIRYKGVIGGQTQKDPYFAMAQILHDTILNNVDMIQVSIDILGDPYFLVNGAMGTNNLTLSSQYLATDGQAPITQGDLMIGLNFRSPVDIDTNGFSQFGSQLAYSGVYRVTNIVNNFKEGLFTQSLELLRAPGQTSNGNTANPANSIKNSQSTVPGTQVISYSNPNGANLQGIAGNDFNLQTLTGNSYSTVGSSQSSGQLGIIDSLTGSIGATASWSSSNSSVGVNISASAVESLTSSGNSSAASIASVGNVVGSFSIGGVNVSVDLATNLESSVSGASGITQSVTGISSSDVNSSVGNISTNITSVQNPSNGNSILANAGINETVISGISNNYSTNIVSSIQGTTSNLPGNTSLATSANSGVNMSNISPATIANLPPNQPSTSYGSGAYSDPAVSTPSVTSNNLPTNSTTGNLAQWASSNSQNNLSTKISSANSQIQSVAGSYLNVTSNVGSTNQNTMGTTPPASVGLGSVESNQLNVSNVTKDSSVNVSLSKSALIKYGSKQSISPLITVLQENNG